MFSSAYSRSAIISFLELSLKEIQSLLARFQPGEYIDPFIIKLKMMAHLAEQAFGLSLKVSYLDETLEYHRLVDTLDNIYLQLADYRMRYKAYCYGFLVLAEFDEMIDKLGLLDERLKTMKIVCQRPRSRNYVKHRKEGSCWVDEHGFRMRTPVKALPQEDKEEDEEDEDQDNESAEDRFERNQILIKRYSKRDSLFDPSQAHHQTLTYEDKSSTACAVNVATHMRLRRSGLAPVPELSAEEKAIEEKNKEFILQSKKYINEFNNSKMLDPLSTDKILFQCHTITEFCNYLLQHAEFVATKNTYRNYSKRPNSKKHSFMQLVIKKCIQLAREVTEKYDELRAMKLRANPELRKAKSNALAILEKVKQVYAEYYVKHPFESEPLADLLSA